METTLTKNKFMNALLKEWLNRVATKKSWNSFDDIHIDQLDKTIKKSEWIKKGFVFFEEAINCGKKVAPDLLIVLAFSLKGFSKYKGINFKGMEMMIKELEDSPPSIYAFPKDFKFFKLTIQHSLIIQKLEGTPNDITAFYHEFINDGEDQYRRSILFIKNNDLKKTGIK